MKTVDFFRRSYYLLVALGAEGELIFEEDREGSVGAYGVHIKDRSFLNGARHSVYYYRVENKTTLLVSRYSNCFETNVNNILLDSKKGGQM